MGLGVAGDATVAALANILKTTYEPKLRTMTYPESVLFGRMKKVEKFGGNNRRVSLRYGTPQGGSMTFASAQSFKGSSNDAAFLLTRAKDYHVSGITAEAMLAGEGDENALMSAIKGEMDGSTSTFGRSVAAQLYRNGGGQRGQISAASNVATATITLAEPSDVVLWETQMKVQGSAADGTSGAILAGGNAPQILSIDRDAGTLTTTEAAWNTTVAFIAGSYLFRSGDFGLAAKGLLAWLPTTAPTAGDSFFGQDRSFDAVRLAGVRFAATAGASKEDTLIDCSARLGRERAKPDAVYMNNLDRADIVKNLMGKAIFEMTTATDGVIGYKALVLEGDKGPLKIFADPNCPKGKFFMLQEDTWEIRSIKGVPHFIDEDGNKFLREAASDGYEWRMRALWQVACDAPGYNAVGTF